MIESQMREEEDRKKNLIEENFRKSVLSHSSTMNFSDNENLEISPHLAKLLKN